VEAQEDGFSTALAALISDLLGRLAREELAQDFLDDEAVTLLMDRESCTCLSRVCLCSPSLSLSLSYHVHCEPLPFPPSHTD